jgi:hypothetical protein
VRRSTLPSDSLLGRRSRPQQPSTHSDVEDERPTLLRMPRRKGGTASDQAKAETARIAPHQTSATIPPPAPDLPSHPELSTLPLAPLDEARLFLACGDATSALDLLESVLRRHPTDTDARELAQDCHGLLVSRYLARVGSLSRVPKLAVTPERLASLPLERNIGFVLALVDGTTSLETIVDGSGLSPPVALALLVQLYEDGVIVLRP